MSDDAKAYTLGFEFGRALVIEARHTLETRALQRESAARRAGKGGNSPAARALHTLTASSRFIRRSVRRSQGHQANAGLRGDHINAAWWQGHIDGLRSILQ